MSFPAVLDGDWIDDIKTKHNAIDAPVAGPVRQISPEHYVFKENNPAFQIRTLINETNHSQFWVVYFDDHSLNVGNSVHGGCIATIMDSVVSIAGWQGGSTPVVTGNLEISYKKAVSVHKTYLATAHVVEDLGRKVITRGELIDPNTGKVHATAQATMVKLNDAPRMQLRNAIPGKL